MEQGSLYIASVAFIYAVWENYAEDLAIELTSVISEHLDASKVPDKVRALLESATPWELSVHPGWQELWRTAVRARAKGDDESTSFGMNTANLSNVQSLLELTGVSPVPTKIAAPGKKNDQGATIEIPGTISVDKNDMIDTKNLLKQLISVRGEAVHTARTSSPLKKATILWWNQMIVNLYIETDQRARRAATALINGTPITESIMTEP